MEKKIRQLSSDIKFFLPIPERYPNNFDFSRQINQQL